MLHFSSLHGCRLKTVFISKSSQLYGVRYYCVLTSHKNKETTFLNKNLKIRVKMSKKTSKVNEKS